MDALDITRAFAFGHEARRTGQECAICPEQAHTMARALGWDHWAYLTPQDRERLETAFVAGWNSAKEPSITGLPGNRGMFDSASEKQP